MLPHLVRVPDGEAPPDGWPLVLFLHGIGERGRGGSDFELLVDKSPPLSRWRDGWRPPFVLVAPQCPPTSWWNVLDVMAVLDQAIGQADVDPTRIHLTGLSMGGNGAWATAATNPTRFASLTPICGPQLQSGPWDWAGLARIPTWIFHGEADPIVEIFHSRLMVEQVRAAGGDPRLTVYPELGHDCWTRAYNDPVLWDWMLTLQAPSALLRDR